MMSGGSGIFFSGVILVKDLVNVIFIFQKNLPLGAFRKFDRLFFLRVIKLWSRKHYIQLLLSHTENLQANVFTTLKKRIEV